MGALFLPAPWPDIREPGVIRDRATRWAWPWAAPFEFSAGQEHAPRICRTMLQTTDGRALRLFKTGDAPQHKIVRRAEVLAG